jgi:general secretion pathway protein K
VSASARGAIELPPAAPARRFSVNQHGVALITALLIVSLATVAALAMVSAQQLGVARTLNLVETDQAYLYALGVEDWVVGLLKRGGTDFPGNRPVTTLRPPVSEPGVELSATIEDMQARFNINNLVRDGRPNIPGLKRFRRLLDVLRLDPGLAEAAVDWIDADLRPTSPGGAEDAFYLRRTPAYRAGNGPLASWTELALLKGFPAPVLDVLAPYVSALPELTVLNVNTASPTLLMTLADGIERSDAEQLAQDRGARGFQSLDQLAAHPALRGKVGATADVGVSSDYYRMQADVVVGRGRVQLVSLLRRDTAGKVQVLMRSQGSD